jgi:hypothetical protein
MRRKPGLGVLKFILLGILFLTVLGFVVMSLWNWLIPCLFHGPFINFWQALGLLLLGKLLFGWHGHHPGWRKDWKEKMRRRMEAMTPEEREKLRERCGQRFGGRGFWEKTREDMPGKTGTTPPPEEEK